MKSLSLFTLLSLFALIETSAQIRIGGAFHLDLNLPEVVITTRRRPPVNCPPYETNVFLGRIDNQNRGRGYSFFVQDAIITYNQDNTTNVNFIFDDGNEMSVLLLENNPNDFNYHVYQRNPGPYNNELLEVHVNGDIVELQNGSLSLLPLRDGTYRVILNLQSRYDGNFNGRISSVWVN